MSAQVTLRGRVIRDPELRYSAKGSAVTRFTVVTADRFKDDRTQEWSERNTTFWDCVAFGQLGEGVAESIAKGDSVLVAGRAYQEEWEAQDGTKRRSLKVTADDVAPSLRWNSAKVNRAARERPAESRQRPEDPWASGPAPEPDAGFNEPPPF